MECAKKGINSKYFHPIKANEQFKISYPENRYPIVHYRDPKTHKYYDNGRISVAKLNRMLRQPLSVISSEEDCIFIARCGIYEGLINEICRTDGKKFKVYLFNEFVFSYWDYATSPYLKERRELQGRDYTTVYCDQQQRAIKSYVYPVISEKMRLDEFTPVMMKDIQMAMRDKGLKAKTINRATGAVVAALKVAYDTGLIRDDVASKIHNIPLDCTERGALTQEEAEKLLIHLKETTQPDTYERWKYLMISICYYTGMRIGEVEALQVSDFTSLNTIIVSHNYSEEEEKLTPPKNKKTRETFPLPPQLVEEVLSYAKLNEGRFIFPSIRLKQFPMRKKNVERMFSKELAAIGISEEEQKKREIVLHSLRHTFTSIASGKVKDKTLVQQSLGHSTMAMTKHYTHETDEARQNFAAATAGLIKYV